MSGNASSAITVLTKITLHPPPADLVHLIDLIGHLFLRYTNHQLHVNEAIYYTIGIKISPASGP